MNCDYDSRETIVIRSLSSKDRMIFAVKALRLIALHATGMHLGLREAKLAIDSLATGGTIKIRFDASDRVLIEGILSLGSLSVYSDPASVLTIG